jgi:DNA-binding transcriptional LysR family regulator
MNLDIDALRCLVAAVDAGTISAAAPRVHRSQPAVSMQLRKLEHALGQQLLVRGARGVQPTEPGRRLLAHARALLAAHDVALDAMRGPSVTGRLVLGVPDDYAPSYLTPLLERIAARHAQLEVALVCEQSTALIPKVQAGEVDLALISRDRAGRGRLLFAEPLVWAASPRHEAWRRDPLPIAVYEATSRARRHAVDALRTARHRFRVVYHSSSLVGQLAAVDSGLAVAALTRCSVPPHVQILGRTQGLPPLEPMQVALLRSQASRGQPAVDVVEAEALQALQGLPQRAERGG